MPISIEVPDYAWSTQTVSINSLSYTFTFKYNTRNQRLYLDLYLGEVPVILGIKLIEGNEGLFSSYLLPDFDHGDLFCVRFKKENGELTQGNIGINNVYELIYLSNEELGVE